MNEAKINPDDPTLCYMKQPTLDGLICEVQHAFGQGDPAKGPGSVGAGIITMPTGQPRVVIQLKHDDGTSLSAMLKTVSDLRTLIAILVDVDKTALEMASAAAAAARQ